MAVLLFFLVLFILIALWRLKRHLAKNTTNWAHLTERVYAVEQETQKLAALASRLETIERNMQSEPVVRSASAKDPATANKDVPVAYPSPPPRVEPPQPAFRTPVNSILSLGSPSQGVIQSSTAVPVPTELSAAEWLKDALNLEEMIGENLFTKLGVILLVLGLSLFVATQWHRLGPGVRILIGYCVSGLMLVPGIIFEHRERWRILARAGIGGGWALLYFVTYAMHHVVIPAVISSEAIDLVLMLIVAAGMVAHTLKYRSQVVTGLAFLLGFTTVTISHVSVYSLLANALLAVALVIIVWQLGWYELEVFGILAVFLNHYVWVHPIIGRVGAHHAFADYSASCTLLFFYWLLFNLSYVTRRIKNRREESVSTLALLLNVGLFLGLMGYQAVYPPHTFEFFLVVGAVEVGLGQLQIMKRRRTAFALLTTVGTTLLMAAFPYKFSGSDLSVLWLAEAEGFFLAGILTREVIFRGLGLAALTVTVGQMLLFDATDVAGTRWGGGHFTIDAGLAILFGFAAAVLYVNAHWVSRRWDSLTSGELESWYLQILSYVAGAAALVGVWLACPDLWSSPVWMTLALALMTCGRRWKIPEWPVQSYVISGIAFLHLLVINLRTGSIGEFDGMQAMTIGISALLFYLCSRWCERPGWFARLPESYTWMGTTLIALLAWHQLRPVAVAVGWALLSTFLLELGIARSSISLRFQGYALFTAAFVRLLFSNLNAAGAPGELSPRVYTMVPVALMYLYTYWRLNEGPEDYLWKNRWLKASEYHCCLATASIALLIRFELPETWAAIGWAVMIVLLLTTACMLEKKIFLVQGLLLGLATVYRTAFYNLYRHSYFSSNLWQSRSFSVSTIVALLLLALVFAFRLRTASEAGLLEPRTGLRRAFNFLYRQPQQFFFLAPVVLLTILLSLDLRSGLVTLAWGGEAVAIVVFALLAGERSFRLTGLTLLLLCVGKVIVVDLPRLWGTNYFYLTLIGLGTALVLVSYLYARYRETFRRLL